MCVCSLYWTFPGVNHNNRFCVPRRLSSCNHEPAFQSGPPSKRRRMHSSVKDYKFRCHGRSSRNHMAFFILKLYSQDEALCHLHTWICLRKVPTASFLCRPQARGRCKTIPKPCALEVRSCLLLLLMLSWLLCRYFDTRIDALQKDITRPKARRLPHQPRSKHFISLGLG